MTKYKVFIGIKEKSQRIKNKNFIKIKNNIPLFKILLYKLNKFQIFIDTDSSEIIKSISRDKKLSNVKVYLREKKFVDMENNNKNPGPYMIKKFLENYVENENEPVIHTHVTSPFLKQKTLLNALKYMNKGFYSVSSCNLIKKTAFIKKKKIEPINFSLDDQHQRTQSLKSIIVLNSAFFIFRKKNFMKTLQRVSKKNYFYELNFPESIDIDYKEDIKLSRLLKNSL
jgi:CMP-N-acetylneuraminic acid synthetase